MSGTTSTGTVDSIKVVLQEAAVDLVMEGVCQELLDSAQVEICVADRSPTFSPTLARASNTHLLTMGDTRSWVGHYSALVTPSRTCLS